MEKRQRKYVVELPPQPWQRAGLYEKRFFDRQRREKLAYGLYLQKQHKNEPLFVGPISLRTVFYLKEPVLLKERNNSPVPYHYKRPDLDNLVKFFLDSAHGILYDDDKIIAEIIAKKLYAKKPRTEIEIIEL